MGLCSENLSGVSNLSLDSTGGQISCGAGSNYSAAVTTYLSSCGPFSGHLETFDYQTNDTVSIPLTGSFNCGSSENQSLLSQHQLALVSVLVLTLFFVGLALGHLYKISGMGLK